MAYNRYEYETSPRKIQPDYDTGKKQLKEKKISNNKDNLGFRDIENITVSFIEKIIVNFIEIQVL